MILAFSLVAVFIALGSQLGSILGGFRLPSWGQVDSNIDLKPIPTTHQKMIASWIALGTDFARFGVPTWRPSWPKLAPTWPPSWPKIQLGPNLDQLGPKLAPTWPELALTWPQLRVQLGPNLAPTWPNLGGFGTQVGAKLAPR